MHFLIVEPPTGISAKKRSFSEHSFEHVVPLEIYGLLESHKDMHCFSPFDFM